MWNKRNITAVFVRAVFLPKRYVFARWPFRQHVFFSSLLLCMPNFVAWWWNSDVLLIYRINPAFMIMAYCRSISRQLVNDTMLCSLFQMRCTWEASVTHSWTPLQGNLLQRQSEFMLFAFSVSFTIPVSRATVTMRSFSEHLIWKSL